MATVAYTRVQPGAGEDMPTGIAIYQWVLAASDDGAPVMAPHYSGKVVQKISGTGTALIEGSLHLKSETPTYATLNDPQGGPLTNLVGIEQILEDSVLVRPRETGALNPVTVRLMITTSARR